MKPKAGLFKVFRVVNGVRKSKARCIVAALTADEAIDYARKHKLNVERGMALVAKRISDAETRDYIARKRATLATQAGAEILRKLEPKGTC
jgi:hypothetical protein